MNPVAFYKCLADDTRLRSLLLIAHEGELCVCELMEALSLSQPKISRHLAQMRQCALLNDRRQGQWVFYSLNPSLPEWARQVLDTTLAENLPFISDNLQALAQLQQRPAREERCCPSRATNE
ncbi:metalloregulator ArsR/SmtB family transcription factor [Microbulbifer salipaludis]|uniref:Metalloregulator ArsR/SmtB family transcription factor n=1 Tax=Microbulbifer salipaludis TaxID=187980 RepID=A0ABS3E8N0_9GAMM|nr:metalloregulator ArsR/SmtB family transcription factor [Microbulbifer salipaludis]MBN8431634.1 metalloregulator ArsR/SmtB family transcription factor [Microbulbifer salipaludis]